MKEIDALNTSSSKLLISLVATSIFFTLVNIHTLIGLVRRKKSKLFRYLLVMAVVDLISCCVFSLQMIVKVLCETPGSCAIRTVFILASIKYTNAEFLLPSFSWINVLVESYITIQRLFSVCTISHSSLLRIKNAPVWKASLVCCITSLSIHLHRYSTRSTQLKASNINNTTTSPGISDFIRVKNAYGQKNVSSIIMTVVVALQLLIMIIVLFFINIVIIIKLKSYMKRRYIEYSKQYL